ncbi:unnamed protein product [Ceutorhynchus assimilis]|uniref:Gag-like protein n=1 Tax=Ceutorhynchus assimilis TaxID=467358 RepID=A0A9N9M8Z2_9CUCU|nr:unnamed protein product [Ceutorhynchus assimilis]
MEGNELNEDQCVKCKNNCEEEYYNCDSCLKRIHRKCSNIAPSEARCMPLQKRMLLLICEECKSLIARMPFIIRMLEEIQRDVEALKTARPKESYAAAVVRNETNREGDRTCLPTIIIKPKKNQNPQESKSEIQRSINPSTLKLGIRNIKETKQGNIVVKCDTEQDLKHFRREAEDKLGENYEMELPKKYLPKVKIAGYSGGEPLEIIEEKIRNQNKWINSTEGLKITYIKSKKNAENSTIYAECSGTLFNKMIAQGKIYINWQRLPVYEDLTVSRCFRCQGFNHKSAKCSMEQVCQLCRKS